MTDTLPTNRPNSDNTDHLPVFFRHDSIPPKVKRLLGCNNCEWRAAGFCPSNYSIKDKGHPDGICMDRINYFSTYLPPDNPNPSFEDWRDYFNIWQSQGECNLLFAKMKVLERKIEKGEQDMASGAVTPGMANMEIIAQMKNQYNQTWHRWRLMNEHILESSAKREAIRKPKKIEITDRKELTIHQIREIMRDDTIVEAKFTEHIGDESK